MARSTYCPLPWIHLGTHPNGMVNLCCEAATEPHKSYSYDVEPGVVKHLTLNNSKIIPIMNSYSFREVRRDMLNGIKPVPCTKCYDLEDSGIISKRQKELRNFPQFDEGWAREFTSDNGYWDFSPMVFLELRLGNQCNLKCVTCNPASSNQWQSDYDNLYTMLPWMDRGMITQRMETNGRGYGWVTDPAFWDDLLHRSDDVKVIYINGGEPTLNKPHLDYLETLVKNGRGNEITLWYSINATTVPQRMLDIWSKFKTVKVGMSLDGIEERAEYLRYPCRWSEIEKNVQKLKAVPNLELSVTHTISILNIAYYDEMYNWCAENNLHMVDNFVSSPRFLDFTILGTKIVKQIILDMKHLPINEHDALENRSLVMNLLQKGLMEQFKSYITALDALRGTSWEKSLPKLMKYI